MLAASTIAGFCALHAVRLRRGRPAAAGLAPGVPRPVRGALGDLRGPTGPPALPEDLFAIQANRYASYHIPFAKDFYSKQDFWAIPEDRSGPIRQGAGAAPLPPAAGLTGGPPRPEPMRPYYLLARLPGEPREHFVLVVPFTPNNKQNMVAYPAARADPDGYGTITLFNLPRSRTVFGPTQVNAQILADPDVAKELTLFNQQGSTVTLGNLLTVPVGDALLYAQPIFIQASQGAIPQLRRVAVFLNGDLGYTATLEGSLAQILGEAPPSGPSPGPGGPGQPPRTGGTALARILAQEAEAFRQAQAALDRRNLGAYQRAIDRLGELIRQAQQLTGTETPPGTSTAPASTTPTTGR